MAKFLLALATANNYLVHRNQQPITETMNPDFCFTKFLTNQIVFDNEKNLQ